MLHTWLERAQQTGGCLPKRDDANCVDVWLVFAVHAGGLCRPEAARGVAPAHAAGIRALQEKSRALDEVAVTPSRAAGWEGMFEGQDFRFLEGRPETTI